jgi:hypothetical protein
MSTYAPTNLQEITGTESGAIQYQDGNIWIGNWSHEDGIPHYLAPIGMIGLGEQLRAKRCAVPPGVKRAMQDHDRDQGNDTPAKTGYRAWRVNGVTVVIQNDWN